MRMPAVALLTICAATSLMAADQRIADLRFGLGAGPMPDHQQGTLNGSTASDGYSGGTAVSGTINVTYGFADPVGLVWGGELNYLGGSMDMRTQDGAPVANDAPTAQFTQTSFVLAAGLGIATGITSHAELTGLAGICRTTLDAKATTAEQRGQGNGYVFGGRLGWYWTSPSRWQVGLQADWTRADSDLKTRYLNGLYTSNVVNQGFGGRAIVGYRF
jgi:hypothetical protein